MSTPAAPGLFRQGNTHIARSASSLASNVFPIRLRRVYAYTFSLVPCFYRRRSPLQLRSTAGANAMSTWCWSHSVSLSSACFILGFTHFLFPWLSDLRSSCKDFPFIASRFRIVHAFAFSAQAFIFVFISGTFMHITIFNRFFLSFFLRLLPYVFSLLSRLFCSLAGLGTGWSKRRAAAAAVYDTIPQSHIVDSVFLRI